MGDSGRRREACVSFRCTDLGFPIPVLRIRFITWRAAELRSGCSANVHLDLGVGAAHGRSDRARARAALRFGPAEVRTGDLLGEENRSSYGKQWRCANVVLTVRNGFTSSYVLRHCYQALTALYENENDAFSFS